MNSVLNPEAPEFFPHLTSVTKDGYQKVNKTIRATSHMPSGASYDLFKTITDFNKVSAHLTDHVLDQSNQIILTELPAVKLKRINLELNTEKVTDANDSMLDRVNINLDVVNGVTKPDQLEARSGAATPWNAAPVIAKIQVGTTMLIGAKNIQRPQLSFKDPVDNSDSLWVPKISDKPNSIKPLALNILYNDEGEAVGYEHPYDLELKLYQPPAWAMERDASPPAFPKPLTETTLTLVQTEPQLDALLRHLDAVAELAVDVEHHSYRSYQGITCLVQISTNEGGDFIVDTLALREHIHKLNLAFTDPKKIKVFHGAERDVVWLQRDFGVYVVGLFDTHQAARALALPGLSLKWLLHKYCQVEADKKYQLADWRIRPLPEELVEYARSDTHYLLYIWRRMKDELLRAAPPLLAPVFERSRRVSATTYNKTVVNQDSHMPLYLRSKKSFNSRQLAALKMLYKWRDTQARELDEGDIYLLPNHMLLSLAEMLPRDVQGVTACCSPMPPFVRTNLITIHRMLLSCRELPLEPQLYPMPAGISGALNAQQPAIFQIHDFSHHPEYSEELPINLDRYTSFIGEPLDFQSDIPVFMPNYNTDYVPIVSELSVDAKQFIPPYVRYRRYRELAQLEEMKEYREKEAKIAAIGKGDDLIKSEVLDKLKQAKTQIENEQNKTVTNVAITKPETEADVEENSSKQRKRKAEAADRKETAQILDEIKNVPEVKHSKPESKKVEPYLYKNANYKKFFDNKAVVRNPKNKLKKH